MIKNKIKNNFKKKQRFLSYLEEQPPKIKTFDAHRTNKIIERSIAKNHSSYKPSLQYMSEQMKRKGWEDEIEDKESREPVKRSISVYENTNVFKPLTLPYGSEGNFYDSHGNLKNVKKLKSKFNSKYFTTKKNLIDYRKADDLRKLYALCLFYSRIRSADPNQVTVLPIAQTQFALIRIFGSQVNVSNLLESARTCGLIECQDERYVFVSETTWNKEYWKQKAFCKKYFYYKKVEDELLTFCKDHNIKPWTKDDNAVPAVYELPEYIQSRIKISSRIKGVEKPDIISTSEFEQSIRKVLEQKYPEYLEIQKAVQEVNSCPFYQEHPELQLKGEFTIKIKDGKLKKIGFRVTNRACSVSKEEKNNQIYRSREVMLNALNLNGTSHDVKSSIPRVMYLLSHGTWLPETVDIYKMIFDRMKENGSRSLEDYSTFTPELRDFFKTAFMTVNFSKSEQEASSSLSHRILKPKNRHEVESQRYFKEEYSEEYFSITSGTRSYLDLFVHEYRNALIQTIGFTSSSSIFLYESLIYINVLKELVRHSNVFECYDAFYLNTNIDSNYIENLIEEKALQVYRTTKNTLTFDRYADVFNHNEITVSYKNNLYCSDNFVFNELSFYHSIVLISESLTKININLEINNVSVLLEIKNNEIKIDTSNINSSKNEIIDYVYLSLIRAIEDLHKVRHKYVSTKELRKNIVKTLAEQALCD